MYTKIGKQIKGGMALPNLENYYKAAQLRPIAKWCDEEHRAKWKDIARKVANIPTQSLIGNPKLSKSLQESIDTIISHTLNIWFDLVKRHKLEKHQIFELVCIILSYNFSDWGRKGLTATCIPTMGRL